MRYALAALLALSPSISLACVMYVDENLEKAMAEVDHAKQEPVVPVIPIVPAADAVPADTNMEVILEAVPVQPEATVPGTIPEATPPASAPPAVADPKS